MLNVYMNIYSTAAWHLSLNNFYNKIFGFDVDNSM
jgi:hypothetical protein